MTTKLNTIPNVVEKDVFEWGVRVATGSSLSSHTVLGMTGKDNFNGEYSPETVYKDVIADSIKASDVQSNGVNLYADLGAADTPLSGSGNLELYRIVGVANHNAPLQEEYVTWGFNNSTQNVGYYSGTVDNTTYFGDARRVAIRSRGLLWIKFSGSSAPTVGQYVQPSSGSDGYAEVCPSGSAPVNITYGKIWGYASGSNIGGFDSNGDEVSAQFVLVDFERGSW